MKWIFTATVISLIFILACFFLPQWEIAQWWKDNPSLKGTQNETTTREKPTDEPETLEDKLKELEALEAQLARTKAEGAKRVASLKHQMEQNNQAILALQDSVTDPNGPLTEHEQQQLAKVLSDLEAIGIEKFESIAEQAKQALGLTEQDENKFRAQEDAFDESLSESDMARYLLLLAEWVRTGETDAVERFRAEHGHPDP